MGLSNAERQRKWWEKNRALHNLRRRKAYNEKKDLVKKEPVVQTDVPRIEMAIDEKGAMEVARKSTMDYLRSLEKSEREKPTTDTPESTDTRSAKDIVGGIYRNDNGGVISKFAWEKLQKMKEHAAKNNFVIDDYSQ